jgi:O-acetyl-ADP-ribose deacetylase (regulator of RNase III)
LASAYRSAFDVAKQDPGVRSIALPAISTGIYHFPKDLAATIALTAMLQAEPHFDRIVACLFDQESEALYASTLVELRNPKPPPPPRKRRTGEFPT